MKATWVRIATDIADHPKSLLLEMELGERNAWAYMVRLWAWLTEFSEEEGRIDPALAPIVERKVGWPGEPGRLFSAAQKVGFLDADSVRGGWVAHRWEQHNGAAIRKAKSDAERKRTAYESAKVAGIKEEKSRAEKARRINGESAEKKARRAGTGRDETRRDVTKDSYSSPPQIAEAGWKELVEGCFHAFKEARGVDPSPHGKDWASLKRLSARSKSVGGDAEILRRWGRGLKGQFKERVDCFADLEARWDSLTGTTPPARESAQRDWTRGRVGAEEADKTKLAAGDKTSEF